MSEPSNTPYHPTISTHPNHHPHPLCRYRCARIHGVVACPSLSCRDAAAGAIRDPLHQHGTLFTLSGPSSWYVSDQFIRSTYPTNLSYQPILSTRPLSYPINSRSQRILSTHSTNSLPNLPLQPPRNTPSHPPSHPPSPRPPTYLSIHLPFCSSGFYFMACVWQLSFQLPLRCRRWVTPLVLALLYYPPRALSHISSHISHPSKHSLCYVTYIPSQFTPYQPFTHPLAHYCRRGVTAALGDTTPFELCFLLFDAVFVVSTVVFTALLWFDYRKKMKLSFNVAPYNSSSSNNSK